MERKLIYFDNAATSYPKPEAVYAACDQALRTLGSSGRGGHKLSLDAARAIFEGREQIATFLGCLSERLIFTSSCTASINLVLNGLVASKRLAKDDIVLCSSYEHNAVMRPLHWLETHHGIKYIKIAPAASHHGLIDLNDFEKQLQERKPKLCVLSLASNVTGELLNLTAANELAHRYGVPILIDGAQGAGLVDLKLDAYAAISYFAASAHKGLLGPPGLGLLYLREGENLDPPYCGGTGSRSESLEMPENLPDRLEPGTAAAHLITGLAAGVEHLLKNGEEIREHEKELALYFLNKIQDMPGVLIHGRGTEPFLKKAGTHLPTFALSIKGVGADKVADVLDQQFGICVRPGLHCAVSAHDTLGTASGGLVRVSFGAFNSEAEVDSLCSALSTWLETA